MEYELTSNKRIAEQVEKILDSGRSTHAFLFIGGSVESREEIGIWMCRKILCTDELSRRKFDDNNCEDFLLIQKPENKESILKDQILELAEKLAFKPYGDKYAVLIKDAHLMNAVAQNKLLKTLEEPVSEAVIVLLSEREDAILDTVRSRCTSFYLEEDDRAYSAEALAAAKDFAMLIARDEPYYKRKACIRYILDDKDEMYSKSLEFLDALETKLEQYILTGNPKCLNAIRYVEQTKAYILQKHNVAYTLKQMCLK